jgi:acyl-CoA synthetase (AMP-forming)/AMP-acid ligase II
VATRDCSSLEYVLYGAAPMSVDKLREGSPAGARCSCKSMASPEVPGVITCLSRKDHSCTATRARQAPGLRRPPFGRLRGGADGRRRQHRGVGERGEIVARGDLVSPGYYNNPEATAEAARFGWHHTGDIGVFDENGYLYVVDRKKDMVISGGFNIYPSEIEQVIWGPPRGAGLRRGRRARRRLGRAPDRGDRAQAGQQRDRPTRSSTCGKQALRQPEDAQAGRVLARAAAQRRSARC